MRLEEAIYLHELRPGRRIYIFHGTRSALPQLNILSLKEQYLSIYICKSLFTFKIYLLPYFRYLTLL